MEKITIRKENGLTEIIINGNLNIHSIDLLEVRFRDIIAESGTTNTIAVNCENLDSIDSSGLGMLISLSKQAEKNDITKSLYKIFIFGIYLSFLCLNMSVLTRLTEYFLFIEVLLVPNLIFLASKNKRKVHF